MCVHFGPDFHICLSHMHLPDGYSVIVGNVGLDRSESAEEVRHDGNYAVSVVYSGKCFAHSS